MAPNLLTPALVSPVLAFMVWRRARRQFGRQPVRRGAMLARVTILAVLAGVLSLSGLRDPRLLEGLLAGLLGGVALGLLGLRLTRFERGADGRDLYLPNPWIGATVTALLVGRLAWRFLVLMPQAGAFAPVAPGLQQPGSSPLTLLVIGLMIGYYLSYYAGLLVHHRRFQRAQG
ncbi:MAG TPA: DUF1453 domain-containing protein [Frateuria sp.]|uniref:DUF1453 domain-containing protein n=1 Tax=Frateuria sp. TaxID=2211372 RepID=UPI002D8005FE|nr:DUF1453 domain-containing protein [Frateuria sp.]HET6805099.1 DUF1453 domain-containing protein [Frateuria sp.]